VSARERLTALLRAELEQPVLPGALRLADELRARHADAVVGVLFYGSCLRRETTEGVLDYYVVVSGYRAAYRSALPALAARALPPNVHYVELPAENLRSKYAVISLADFGRQATPASLDCRVWSRFCQPARIAWARDAAARAALAEVAAQASITMAQRMLAWAPGDAAERSLAARELWARAFQETYAAELRSEAPATIDALTAADPARYERVARAALAVLEKEDGALRLVDSPPGTLRVVDDPRARQRARRAWRVRRVLAKSLAIAGLLKTAFTFEGWLPYVVWKLERHSGTRIELSERQRRRPLLFAWPVIFRLIREGVLR
jgi:hypothetical protein